MKRLLLVLFLLSSSAFADTLSPTLYATLKTYINNTAGLNSQPNNGDGNFEVARQLNLPTQAFYVWRTSVPKSDLVQAPFDWTRVDNLSVGKARIWDWMPDPLNPTANIRSGWLAMFTTVSDQPCLLAMGAGASRLGSVVEQVLIVVGSGAGTVPNVLLVGPATMRFEGPISAQDVQAARSS